MSKIKDTDYLFLSTRIRVLEQAIVTSERMERMLDASTDEEAVRVLTECGYPELSVVDVDSINAALVLMRNKLYEDLYAYAPDPRMIDVFKLKYDYHNAKTLLKSQAMGLDPSRLLVDVGRYSANTLKELFQTKKYHTLSKSFAEALKTAEEVIQTTRDPQKADFVLDRAYFAEMKEIARATGSSFLTGYVEKLIDAANLRSVVRVMRMGKHADYLKNVLFDGGSVSARSILLMAEKQEKLESVYHMTAFSQAAEDGQSAISGGSLTDFERSCDNAVMHYVAGAKYIPFGEAVLVGYLAAKESELTAVRIIMTGRLAGLPAELIRERLRDAYV